jgi:hypothetical protein
MTATLEEARGPADETGWGRPRDLGRRDQPWPKQAEVGQAGEEAEADRRADHLGANHLGADGHITDRDAGT